MTHFLPAVFVMILFAVGCDSSPPKVSPVVIPKDYVRLEPGPVDADAPEEFTTTESGLKYRIRRKSGGKVPAETDFVRIHMRVTLESSGAIINSTYGKFGRSEAIAASAGTTATAVAFHKSLGEGLLLVDEGGMIELLVRPELAFGETGMEGVPPNSTLRVILEPVEIVSAESLKNRSAAQK